jgi:hypothetical protein
MAERIENGKRYFRRTVDCDKHGAASPAFYDYEADYGGLTCCRCGADEAMAKARNCEGLHNEGGEEAWEWLEGHRPVTKPSVFHEAARASLKAWNEVWIRQQLEAQGFWEGKGFISE